MKTEWDRLRDAIADAHEFGSLSSDDATMLYGFIERSLADLVIANDTLAQEMARTGWAFVPESGLGLVYSILLRVTARKPFDLPVRVKISD